MAPEFVDNVLTKRHGLGLMGAREACGSKSEGGLDSCIIHPCFPLSVSLALTHTVRPQWFFVIKWFGGLGGGTDFHPFEIHLFKRALYDSDR